MGETCLHLAGIPGSATITAELIQRGADPNVRSTFYKGLRMHPLSWNVYGGHVEAVKVLLNNGADVNLDYDDPAYDGTKITVLDTVQTMLDSREEKDAEKEAFFQRFEQIKEMLLEKGAKKYSDLSLKDDDREL